MFTCTKIADYYKYCKDCKHFIKKESEDPCYDCLASPGNLDSHRPVGFEMKNANTKTK